MNFIDYPQNIDRNKLREGDKNEYLKFAYSLNPNKFKRIIRLQIPRFEVISESNFSNLLDDKNFSFSQFLISFKSNTRELIESAKEKRFVAK